MKVIKIKNYNPFKAIGVNILKIIDQNGYGIVSDNYNNGTEIFRGTKKKCQVYIDKLEGGGDV